MRWREPPVATPFIPATDFSRSALTSRAGAPKLGCVVMYSLLRAEWMTRLEALPYRNVDISKFDPYGDVSFP